MYNLLERLGGGPMDETAPRLAQALSWRSLCDYDPSPFCPFPASLAASCSKRCSAPFRLAFRDTMPNRNAGSGDVGETQAPGAATYSFPIPFRQ